MFIVLEGLDGVGKSTAAMRLAERLGARLARTPPDVMRPFRAEFDAGEASRRKAFYEVGNFIAGQEARAAIDRGESTVCDRYFCSTHAYIMGRTAQSVAALPRVGDPAWPAWPALLQRPTHMFVLTLPHEARVVRLAARVAASGGAEPETAEEALLRESEPTCAARQWAHLPTRCCPGSPLTRARAAPAPARQRRRARRR
jgi:thymidylate kinase